MGVASKLSNEAYEQRLRSLTTELLLAEERERRKIASELHDNIGQSLALIKIRLNGLMAKAKDGEFHDDLMALQKQLARVIEDSRTLVFEISPPVLYRLGLISAIQWLIEKYETEYGMRIDFAIENQEALDYIDESIAVFLFRSTRELLCNIVKHAETNRARVKINSSVDRITLIVEDGGRGIDLKRPSTPVEKRNAYGLFSIEERLKYIGGEFTFYSNPGEGTIVKITAPLKTKEDPVDGIMYEQQYKNTSGR